MRTIHRLRASALCALIVLCAAGAATPARALDVPGAYLVHAVTSTEPAAGGDVVVDTVEPFQSSGGIAIFEPDSGAREVFTYSGIDESTSELTGVVRTTPTFHPGGSFVQSVRDANPSPSPRPSHSPRPKPHESPSPKPSSSPRPDNNGKPSPGSIHNGSNRGDVRHRPNGGFQKAEELAPQPHSFDSHHLDAAASQLAVFGWSEERITSAVYRPFPVGGPATFSNTWGALRYGPAPGQVRGHEGQDIFCDAGTPLLAVTAGRIQFDTNGLGGRIARLHMRGGSYFYYAHLSGWNRDDFATGDNVQPGDVIGYCGHSGDAKTTPNHLHFGWYTKDGNAHNPMRLLVSWLKTANRKATALVTGAKRHEAKTMGMQMLARMFGDSWAPDLSVVPVQEPSVGPSVPSTSSPSASTPLCESASTLPSETSPDPLDDCAAPTVPLMPPDGS
jgi:murein DD-endopeptidase MepM/ murein hydrolase activator NlpD